MMINTANLPAYFTKRNIIITLVLLILIASIPLGRKLVQQQTQLKSRASGSEVKFTGPNVSPPTPCDPSNGNACEAIGNDIQIQVTSPFGP